jgi:hypothetical protein
MKVKVGDTVQIIDCAETYDCYDELFNSVIKENDITGIRFESGSCPMNLSHATVLAIVKHPYSAAKIALIQQDNGIGYLIGTKGLGDCKLK